MNKMEIVLVLVCILAGLAQAETSDSPWWEQEKIRWFWGQSNRFLPPDEPELHPAQMSLENYRALLPVEAELMRELRDAGATVLVDSGMFSFQLPGGPYAEGGRLYLKDEASHYTRRAALAHEHGLRYFVSHNISGDYRSIAQGLGARLAVNRHGRTSLEEHDLGNHISVPYVPCPLDEAVVDEWLLKPALEMARLNIDGLHIDWEAYGATSYDQMGDYLCYCDTCFAEFAQAQGIAETPARAARYEWLQDRGFLLDYLENRRDALTAVYRRVAEQVHAVKSDFIFSFYWGFIPGERESLVNTWRVEGAGLGLHSLAAPLFQIDPSHYWPNRAFPVWENPGYSRIRDLGMKHILGSYTCTLFGGQPEMEISAAQWMYEAAMSHDGYWVWFEHRLGPSDYTAFRIADRAITEVEARAGEYLSRGKQDYTFISLAEQSGDEALGHRVQQRVWHLGDRHLAWVFNTNTEHSLDVLARFPQLLRDREWSVTDLRSGAAYTLDGRHKWTSAELAGGLLLALAKRSDTWVVIAPYSDEVAKVSSSIPGDVIQAHPERPRIKHEVLTAVEPAVGFPIVYTRRNQRVRYSGPSAEAVTPVSGTSVHLIDASASNATDKLLFDIDGYCRAPALSPDRTGVAFACWVNGKGQIYLVHVDGSSPRNISDNEYRDTKPVWSPDGKQIAFLSDRDGFWQLYVMDADGNNQRQLTNGPGEVRYPAWSPDGQQIAFVSDRGGTFDLYVINVDGGGERRRLSRAGNIYEPAWSPDGRKIACVAAVQIWAWDILVVDAQSGAVDHHPLGLLRCMTAKQESWPYTAIHSLVWSPEGKRLAGAFEGFNSGTGFATAPSGVFVATVGEKLEELVTAEHVKLKAGGTVSQGRTLIGGWYWSGDASRHWITRDFDLVQWSPDGDTLAFRSDMDPSGYDFLYTVPAIGASLESRSDTASSGVAMEGAPGFENYYTTAPSESAAIRLDATFSPMRQDGKNVPKPLIAGTAARTAETRILPDGMRVLAETPEFWMFRTDPKKVGETQRWFNATLRAPIWKSLSTHDYWDNHVATGDQPRYIGDGWYVVDMPIPESRGKRVWLHLGAVDENYTLWINGRYVGDNLNAGLTMWDQPVSEEITGKYMEGQVNRIAVRVRNTVAAGGIWKPVLVLTER